MIAEIMTAMINKFFDALLPIGGGAAGGGTAAAKMTILWMSPMQWIEQIAIITIGAAIGAVVGYFIKRGLDQLFKRKNKKP